MNISPRPPLNDLPRPLMFELPNELRNALNVRAENFYASASRIDLRILGLIRELKHSNSNMRH